MSRLEKRPVLIPDGINLIYKNKFIKVEGKLGVLTRLIDKDIIINRKDNYLYFKPYKGDKKFFLSYVGTVRSLIKSMIIGVNFGFVKFLQFVGIGYKVVYNKDVNCLDLSLGYSHLIKYKVPKNILINLLSQTEISIFGIDKCLVGQVASKIRSFRPPELYKGKGIRYSNETIILKEAKKK